MFPQTLREWMADLGAHWLVRWSSLAAAAVMAKSPEVKLAVFGRAGVGKSGKPLDKVFKYLKVCVSHNWVSFKVPKTTKQLSSENWVYFGASNDLKSISRQHLKGFNLAVGYLRFHSVIYSSLPHLCCVSAWPLLSNVFFQHPASIFTLAIIFPRTFVCVVSITTVGGCFWSGLNTFTPTDKSVESLSFGLSIPVWAALARPQLGPCMFSPVANTITQTICFLPGCESRQIASALQSAVGKHASRSLPCQRRPLKCLWRSTQVL